MNDSSDDQVQSNQTDNDKPLETSARLKLLKRKRYALEQLIDFAQNIVSQGQALDDILVLSRPSQTIPDKTRLQLVQMVKSLDDYPDGELQERLAKIDKLVENGVQSMVMLAQTAGQFESDPRDVISKIDQIKVLTEAFRKRAKLAIALRITLQERGIRTNRLELAFDQEMIAERVAELKQEEHECRNNIGAHIEEVVRDCDRLLESGKVPESLRNELTVVRRVMLQNLDHLNAGKSIDTLPVNFEMIVMGDSAPSANDIVDLPSSDKGQSAASENKGRNEKRSVVGDAKPRKKKLPEKGKKTGFSARLFAWLNSPWNVSWKQTSDTKDNDIS